MLPQTATKRYRYCVLTLCLAITCVFGLAETANAITTVYELEGFVKAPIVAQRTHSTSKLHYEFQQYIDRGDLLLSYNDNNTAALVDDIVTIKGTTRGGVCHRSQDCRNLSRFQSNRKTGDGVYIGSGIFSWSFALRNPLDETTDPGNFYFDMQRAGSIRLINGRSGVPTVVKVTAKAHPRLGYAFRLTPEDDHFRIATWLLNQRGVIFHGGRTESLRNEAVFNSRLVAYCVSGNCPTSEIPEPMTLGLLSVGLLGGAAARRRKPLS